MSLAVSVLLMLVAACASCFFALAETALMALGGWRSRELGARGGSHSTALTALLAAPQDYLASLVLGSNFANAMMVALGCWVARERDWPWWTVLPLLAVWILLVCEIAPKALALRDPSRWAERLARPTLGFERGTRLFRRGAQKLNEWILAALLPRSVRPRTGISDEEYKELIELAYTQGALDPSEKEIILQIIGLDRRTARDIMRPRAQMACIPDTLSIEEMMVEARRHKLRRIPVYDGSPDTIVGVLNTQRLLADPQVDLMEAFETPSFVPASMNLLQLFKSLQRQKRGLAIVVDEFGGTAGVVRMEDILEEMLGPLRETSGKEAAVLRKLQAGKWEAGGGVLLEDLEKELGSIPLPPGVATVGGLLLHTLEVVPSPGEFVTLGGFKWTVTKAEPRRVREVLIEAEAGRHLSVRPEGGKL
ncbi:MAG: HlyC/CorC family transporter [Verrucomicrobia bacterium]|nr:HlyC/CorC family transporter [Verrucomicrobiota bacterium]